MLNITVGGLILSPRPRYRIEEVSYEPRLTDNAQNGTGGCAPASGGSCSGSVKNWEIVLKVRCVGHGDMVAARLSYKAIEDFANGLCGDQAELFHRRYCTEDPLEFHVNGGYFKQVDMDWLPGCDCDSTVLSGELHLFTVEVDTEVSGMIYDYNILSPGG